MRPVAQTGRSGDITGVMPARDDAGLEATQIAGAGDTLTASGDGPTSRAEPIGRGASFGRYTVLSRLGAGGMGVVFAAYDPELDRKVALKLLHPQVGAAAASTMGRARLVREAQAMARLSHPNVVAIYDVGTLDDRVWLAMEYVDGRTLGAWLKEQPRRWPEVLQVMLAVGRGLVAAHAAGLVHRDLKPDNIMVDREGRARVMDFGLARSAESRASDAPIDALIAATTRSALSVKVTQYGAVTGTPMYMAPEQWRGEEADARVDQFAFCVTLWESLHGARPFAGESLIELATAVHAGALQATPRVGVPAWLRRALVRGLSVDPERRFTSMEALLTALERGLLRGKRWRVGLGLGALGLAAALVPGWRAYDHARREAACEVAAAQISEVWNDGSRAALAAALAGSEASYAAATFEKMTPWIDRWTRRWSEVRAEVCRAGEVEMTRPAELHARAVTCLDERREELAALLTVIGEDARSSLSRAVTAAASLSAVDTCADWGALERRPDPPDDPAVKAQLAAQHRELTRVRALFSAGRFPQALTQAEALLVQAQEAGLATIVAEAELAVGDAAKRTGDFERSVAALRGAYLHAGALGDDEAARAAATNLISVLGYDQSKPELGLQWELPSEMLLRRLGEFDELGGASHFNALASVYRLQDRFDESQALYERSLRIQERILGPDHPVLAGTLNNLANLLQLRGERDGVLALFTRALEILERSLGPDHPHVALLLGNLGAARYQAGDYDEALAIDHRALKIQEATLGREHPEIAAVLGNIATIHIERRDHAAALPLLTRALAIQEKVLGPEHPRVGDLLLALAADHRGFGNLDEALVHDQRALTIFEKAWGPEHLDDAHALLGLGITHLERGDPARALPLLERALAIREKALEADSYDITVCLGFVALAHREVGDHARARQLFERVLGRCGPSAGRAPCRLNALNNLAALDLIAGDLDAAATGYERSRTLCNERTGADDPHCTFAVVGLGKVALARGRVDDALPLLELAVTLGTRDRMMPGEYGEIRFLLARALRAARREPERARALAEEAAESYRKVGPLRREPAEIAAWLARQGG
jgi:tetratricopeptide (TPR) repeat protein